MTRDEINRYIAHLAGNVDPQTVEQILSATEHFAQTYSGGKLGNMLSLYQAWKKV